MFVRDFIHVARPFEVVAPRIVLDPSWLAPIAEDAVDVARDVARSLVDAVRPGAPTRSTRVRCEVGPVRAHAQSILVPLWIVTEPHDAAFPDLTGDLEVAPVGTTRSLLALGATYERPSRDRDALERAERATEAGVRSFLGGIARVLR